jgi:hypothetical protein
MYCLSVTHDFYSDRTRRDGVRPSAVWWHLKSVPSAAAAVLPVSLSVSRCARSTVLGGRRSPRATPRPRRAETRPHVQPTAPAAYTVAARISAPQPVTARVSRLCTHVSASNILTTDSTHSTLKLYGAVRDHDATTVRKSRSRAQRPQRHVRAVAAAAVAQLVAVASIAPETLLQPPRSDTEVAGAPRLDLDASTRRRRGEGPVERVDEGQHKHQGAHHRSRLVQLGKNDGVRSGDLSRARRESTAHLQAVLVRATVCKRR